MKKLRFALTMVALSAVWLLPHAAAGQPQALFNGKDLGGWDAPDPNPFWSVAEGALIGQNDEQLKGHVLYTIKTNYLDFILETDVRWSGEIDSGIMLRRPELQLQFGVSRSLKKDMTCSFYTGGQERYPEGGQAKGIEKNFREGEWNTVKLQAKGDTFTVWMNGQKVSEYTNSKYPGPGPIGVQVHPGLKMKVEFRNMRVVELK